MNKKLLLVIPFMFFLIKYMNGQSGNCYVGNYDIFPCIVCFSEDSANYFLFAQSTTLLSCSRKLFTVKKSIIEIEDIGTFKIKDRKLKEFRTSNDPQRDVYKLYNLHNRKHYSMFNSLKNYNNIKKVDNIFICTSPLDVEHTSYGISRFFSKIFKDK